MRTTEATETTEIPIQDSPRPARRFVRATPAADVRAAATADAGGPISEGPPARATGVREGIYRRALLAADGFVALAVALVLLPALDARATGWWLAAALPGMMLVARAAGLYHRDDLVLNKTTLDEGPAVLQAASSFTLLVWLLATAGTKAAPGATGIAVAWVAAVGGLLGARTVARAVARRLAVAERCLVVGDRASVEAIREKIEAGRVNAAVAAELALDDARRAPGELPGAFWGLLHRHGVHRAIIAPAAGGSREYLDLIRIAKSAGVRVSVVPRVLEVVGSSVEFDHLDGLTMLGLRRFGLSRSARAVKRAFDMTGAGALLLATAPVMAAIALAIRLDSRGPVLFRQTRVGKDGRRFEMLKFRSMVEGADAQKDALRGENEAEGLFKIAEDPRITRVGRGLRKTSLDELPQLFNVWRGEMSLVGPRPLVVEEDQQVRGLDRQRLHLTPGMTGHWQILGSARIPLHEMVGIDYLYVANWSLWTDVKILLRTIPYMLATRGM